jgi:hypothetical protein
LTFGLTPTVAHPTPPKPTKPFILDCTVIAIVLLSSVLGKLCIPGYYKVSVLFGISLMEAS